MRGVAAASTCWDTSGPSPGGCRNIFRAVCAKAAVGGNHTDTRQSRRAGRERHWRPFRQRERKRNSVNPPLIRYNGSLVVCPVLRSLDHKFACAARRRTAVPNNDRATKQKEKKKGNRGSKSRQFTQNVAREKGETCVGGRARHSAERFGLTCRGGGWTRRETAGCCSLNFRPHFLN